MAPQSRHTLPGPDYHDPAVYELERQRIFFRSWFYAGRLDQVDEPGQFFTVDVAGESVVVTRSEKGGLRAFYNVCRHRGSLICEEPRGSVKSVFQCPYHAWCYDLDGALVATPRVAQDEVDRSSLSLWPVHVDEWQGFVFVNLDRDTPVPLRDALAAQYDSPVRFERFDLAALRTGVRTESVVSANWKIVVENYNECLHCPIVHPELVAVVPSYRKGLVVDPGRTDGGVTVSGAGNSYSQDGRSRLTVMATMTDEEAGSIYGSSVFPNMFIDIAGTSAIATCLVPEGPRQTRVLTEYLFQPLDLASPEFDPSPVVDFSELIAHQDYTVCERVQKGVMSRAFDHGVYPEKDAYVYQFTQEYLAARDGG